MNRTLRCFLDRYPILDYLQRVIRYSSNQEFREDILNWHLSPNYLKIEHFGDENPGKIIYLIEFDNEKSGFFAVYKTLLEHLFFCDKFGLVPVIRFPRGWLYSEGSNNPYEEYFEQPYNISVDSAYKSSNVIRAQYYHRNYINDLSYTANVT